MDGVLFASMDVCECNMPCICDNASMSVNPHNCDDMLLESLDVVDIPNIKLLKKKAKKFNKDLSKLFCENNDLIAKLNDPTNWLRNIKNLLKILLKS